MNLLLCYFAFLAAVGAAIVVRTEHKRRTVYIREYALLWMRITTTDKFVALAMLEVEVCDYAEKYKDHAAATALAQQLINILEVKLRTFVTLKDRQTFAGLKS